jgi:hypothetical protein
MKPHNQNAPGLGRLNDQLGAIARGYRRRVDKERSDHDRKGGPGERETK